MRIDKSVLAIAAVLALVVSGCSGGSSASPAASAVASQTATVATPTPANPDTLFDQAIAEGPAWKSFHLEIALSGTITAAAMKASGNPSWKNLKSDVSLDGTTIEGDMDPVNLACDLTVSIPATAATGTAITGEAIVVDPMMYLKLSSAGPKFHKVKLGTISSDVGLKVAVPTPGGSSLVGLANDVSTLRQNLEAAGVTPTLMGIDQIGGRDAYHIGLSVPLDKFNEDIASAATKPGASFLKQVKIDSATAAIWIYTSDYQLAQVQISGTSSAVGSVSFTMTLTNFDQPVTITAPPASDVAAGA